MADKPVTYPTAPSLVGQKVYLRPATPEDIANTHHWELISEPQLRASQPLPLYGAAEAAELFKKQERSSSEQTLMVVRKEGNLPIGRIRFFGLNSLNRSAELGLMIDPDERRKGYGGEAIRILARYLFRFRGLNKVYAQTSETNTAACKLLEGAGFKRDGVLRHHYFSNNEFSNGYLYSLLLFEVDW